MNKLQALLVKKFFNFTDDETHGTTWTKAYTHILNGGAVRRPTWRDGVQVNWPNPARFFQISNTKNGWRDKWSPYVDDFAATDWILL